MWALLPLVLPVGLALTVAQQVPGSEASGWLTLLNYGVLGMWLFFVVFKPKLHTASEVAGLKEQVAYERAQREKAEATADRLHKLAEEQMIPALSRSTEVIARQIQRGAK